VGKIFVLIMFETHFSRPNKIWGRALPQMLPRGYGPAGLALKANACLRTASKFFVTYNHNITTSLTASSTQRIAIHNNS